MSKKKPPPSSPFASLQALRDELAEREKQRAPGAPTLGKGNKPPAPAKPPTPPDQEEEELALYRMKSGVTPLERGPRRLPRSQATLEPAGSSPDRPTAAAAEEAQADAVHARLQQLVSAPRFEVTDDGRNVEGRRLDLEMGTLRKLRRGLFPIDARLDLHGLRAEDARLALERFLSEKRARGERCVLVIHGKGTHSPGGLGVLRGEISAWLSQGSASPHVAGFATADQGDGGDGAIYVLLAR